MTLKRTKLLKQTNKSQFKLQFSNKYLSILPILYQKAGICWKEKSLYNLKLIDVYLIW